VLELFNQFQPQPEQQEEEATTTLRMQQVLFLKKIMGIVVWFVIAMNVSLFSRDSNNRNWAYLTLFLIKGVNVASAVAKGGKEGLSSGIETSVATIVGTIAGGL